MLHIVFLCFVKRTNKHFSLCTSLRIMGSRSSCIRVSARFYVIPHPHATYIGMMSRFVSLAQHKCFVVDNLSFIEEHHKKLRMPITKDGQFCDFSSF